MEGSIPDLLGWDLIPSSAFPQQAPCPSPAACTVILCSIACCLAGALGCAGYAAGTQKMSREGVKELANGQRGREVSSEEPPGWWRFPNPGQVKTWGCLAWGCAGEEPKWNRRGQGSLESAREAFRFVMKTWKMECSTKHLCFQGDRFFFCRKLCSHQIREGGRGTKNWLLRHQGCWGPWVQRAE